ncbi:tRNA guanosine(15) transglycosylase TgtA [Infirmifilum lucidum]|uniref:tRNA-guanine(15) transglycosylase n=1 Tax=Infirmifilum lucidum TaxID=2776706 RepID=A0A7L9FHM4_9CREN|nr:tRNA guanosine(15) transglycosylase TgtA [Infirmifilum lucidum]QOJ78275.1 tRNA guanosine(15) transglycosylase TgtA [Infirmifilum lucidum]
MTWSEVFEVDEIDLMGRRGKLYTRRGVVETPTLTPVINPGKQIIPPKEIREIGFPMLITNSYIIKRNYGDLAKELTVHGILGVDGPVYTDSGAYQLLVYGKVEVDPLEIFTYQIEIGSDVGVILDIPTRRDTPYHQARIEVEETLRRLREAVKVDRKGMLLVAPIQGGVYTDLVAYSASQASREPADLFAVGGPTQFMEEYDYKELVKLVMTARLNLPWGAPLHLFGAGHPIIMPLAVAMGVDLFDSASYALYARDDRLITPRGTLRLEEVEELPCVCPVCSKYSARELKGLPKQERVRLIAQHNLYVIHLELKRIKQAIHEGRLWDLVEEKTRGHPSLMEAFKLYVKYAEFIAKVHPVTRPRIQGVFFYDSFSRYRPEVVRHVNRLKSRYRGKSEILLLFEETPHKPFTRFGLIKELLNDRPEIINECDIAVLSRAFSIIPIELDGLYPLSQYEASSAVLEGTANEIKEDVVWFALNKGYRGVVLVYYSLPREFVLGLLRRLSGEQIIALHLKLRDYYVALQEHVKTSEEILRAVKAIKELVTRGIEGVPSL